jgi:hypothetical protein
MVWDLFTETIIYGLGSVDGDKYIWFGSLRCAALRKIYMVWLAGWLWKIYMVWDLLTETIIYGSGSVDGNKYIWFGWFAAENISGLGSVDGDKYIWFGWLRKNMVWDLLTETNISDLVAEKHLWFGIC